MSVTSTQEEEEAAVEAVVEAVEEGEVEGWVFLAATTVRFSC